MTNQELAAALRDCASDDNACDHCSQYELYKNFPGLGKCIDALFFLAADALENSETHVAALQKAIKDLRAQLPRWIPVTERLPEDCADVLTLVSGLHGKCTFERAPMLCAWFGDEGWFCNEYPDWNNPGVTHWMPLPEPPSTEGVE